MSSSEHRPGRVDAADLLEEVRREDAQPPPGAVALLGTIESEPSDDNQPFFRVRAGTKTVSASLDAAVDPLLVRQAVDRGAQVLLVWNDGAPIIVGVVATQRALVVDAEGHVDATVESFQLKAKKQLVLTVSGAFVKLADREVEVYGTRVLTRARELAKTLSAMISFN